MLLSPLAGRAVRLCSIDHDNLSTSASQNYSEYVFSHADHHCYVRRQSNITGLLFDSRFNAFKLNREECFGSTDSRDTCYPNSSEMPECQESSLKEETPSVCSVNVRKDGCDIVPIRLILNYIIDVDRVKH